MTARNRRVIKAIVASLRVNQHREMDGFASSYAVPERYPLAKPKQRAAMLLQAILDSEP